MKKILSLVLATLIIGQCFAMNYTVDYTITNLDHQMYCFWTNDKCSLISNEGLSESEAEQRAYEDTMIFFESRFFEIHDEEINYDYLYFVVQNYSKEDRHEEEIIISGEV